VPEPDGAPSRVRVTDVFHASYPDGAHDAETLLTDPRGRLFVVTKGETGGVGIYRFPEEMRSGATVRLERVGEPRPGGRTRMPDRITDGAMSETGEWIALRTRTRLMLHRSSDLLAGRWDAASTVDLRPLGEPQGEGVTFGPGGALFVAGEGGGGKRPGTFARLDCSVP
jgi:hypothetical protein